MENSDKKKLMIIEGSTKRFAHFGLAKTTMNEIAQDLAFSKALLYYYFPDKNSLYIEVFLHIIRKMSDQIRVGLEQFDETEDAMIYFLDQRIYFIQEYYNIINYPQTKGSGAPKALREVYAIAENTEIELIKTILTKAQRKGTLLVDDCEEMAKLILYSMRGIRASILSKTSKVLFPSMEQFREILARQKTIAKLILRGMKAP